MKHLSSFSVSLSGIACGVALALLFLASILPTGTLSLVAIAGLIPFSVMQLSTASTGFFCWVVSSFLGALLLPHKNIPILFTFCFGLYPLFKSVVEQKQKFIGCFLKFIYVMGSFLVCSYFFHHVILHLSSFYHTLSFIFFILCYFLYDYGLSQLLPTVLHFLKPFCSSTRNKTNYSDD